MMLFKIGSFDGDDGAMSTFQNDRIAYMRELEILTVQSDRSICIRNSFICNKFLIRSRDLNINGFFHKSILES